MEPGSSSQEGVGGQAAQLFGQVSWLHHFALLPAGQQWLWGCRPWWWFLLQLPVARGKEEVEPNPVSLAWVLGCSRTPTPEPRPPVQELLPGRLSGLAGGLCPFQESSHLALQVRIEVLALLGFLHQVLISFIGGHQGLQSGVPPGRQKGQQVSS